MSDKTSSAVSALFDLRTVIALLFAVYGIVLTIMGLISGSAQDNAKSGGIDINLWTGLGMLVVAAIFITWMVMRPLTPATAPDAERPKLEKH